MSGKLPNQFSDGQTAEDFATIVAEAVQRGEKVVRVPFENFTVPDALLMQEMTEIQGFRITYAQLFLGALEDLRGLKPSDVRATATPGVPFMAPYSMSLLLTFDDEVK